MTDLDEIRAILRDVAIQQRETQQQLSQLTQRVDSLTALFQEENTNVTQMVIDLGEYVRQQAEQAGQDRSQARIDRAEFRSTVDRLLNVLAERFTSNGHGEE